VSLSGRDRRPQDERGVVVKRTHEPEELPTQVSSSSNVASLGVRSFAGHAVLRTRPDKLHLWVPKNQRRSEIRSDRRLTVTAGVNNFLDRDPPSCFSCSLNGFEGTTYDVPGVFGYLSSTYRMQ
jgi:hypothetical protein